VEQQTDKQKLVTHSFGMCWLV